MQVRIQLTENPAILKTLHDKGLLSRDAEGKEYFSRSFDSREFRFYPRVPLFLNRTVAESLILSSNLCVGPYIGSSLVDALEIVVGK